jgi:hypothetical protein
VILPVAGAMSTSRVRAHPAIVRGLFRPGFEERLQAVQEAVRTGSVEGSVPVEEIVPSWPDRV